MVQPNSRIQCAQVMIWELGIQCYVRWTKSQPLSCLRPVAQDMNKQRHKLTKSSPTVIGKKQDNLTGTYLGRRESYLGEDQKR